MKLSQCSSCKHLDRENIGWTTRCPAFPKGIPFEVLETEVKHDVVIPGQTGETVYEVLPGYEDIALFRTTRGREATNGHDGSHS